MPDVVRALRGPENARLSDRKQLRYGRNGSLAIDIENGTWFDHEAGAGGGVLDFIKREKGLDAGAAIEWIRRELGVEVDADRRSRGDPRRSNGHAEPKESLTAAKRIAATYDYVDERGEVLFQVVRFEPKEFRQRRPEPGRLGAWTWSVKGVRQVPYRLPELEQALATDRAIFIVEGEKDADNLAGWGVAATCNAQGAGRWHRELGAHFRGADVVLVPDNDDAGRAHMEAVGRALARLAARIRLLVLPDLPPKGDVSDFIAAGGTPEHLYQLAERAPAWKPPPPPLRFAAVWFAEVDRALEDPEWLIDDLLTRGDLALTFGPSQSGKSFLASHLSLAVARGADVFGRKTRRPNHSPQARL